jgi:Family of unknown function (DUF6275)
MEKYEQAVTLVLDLLEESSENFNLANVKLVWFTKTLQNWKAMVADITPGGNFYEVTYNGNKNETYIDTYKKVSNVCIPDS